MCASSRTTFANAGVAPFVEVKIEPRGRTRRDSVWEECERSIVTGCKFNSTNTKLRCMNPALFQVIVRSLENAGPLCQQPGSWLYSGSRHFLIGSYPYAMRSTGGFPMDRVLHLIQAEHS